MKDADRLELLSTEERLLRIIAQLNERMGLMQQQIVMIVEANNLLAEAIKELNAKHK